MPQPHTGDDRYRPLFETDRGCVLHCDCCGGLQLHFGNAILGLKIGEKTSYVTPNGREISVEITGVETWGGRSPSGTSPTASATWPRCPSCCGAPASTTPAYRAPRPEL